MKFIIEIQTLLFKQNAYENIFIEMAAILSRPRCVKKGAHC